MVYKLIYWFLYSFSLLPMRVLYFISDVAYVFLFKVAGYRKKVVMTNLETAFPGKSVAERNIIAAEFYRNLCDTFIETIKLLSLPAEKFDKMYSLDIGECNRLVDEGLQLQVHSGHQMNWEFAHLAFARKIKTLWVGVYMRITNPHMDKLFLRIRSRFNSHMVSAQDFGKEMRHIYGKQYALALIADQNPGWPKNSYWLNFFGRPAPFMAGPEKGATRNGTAVVFVNFIKVRRGYYRFEPIIVTEDASGMKEGELTLMYRDFLENSIKAQPSNYLWSHRRWKFSFQPEYSRRWIDHSAPPSANR